MQTKPSAEIVIQTRTQLKSLIKSIINGKFEKLAKDMGHKSSIGVRRALESDNLSGTTTDQYLKMLHTAAPDFNLNIRSKNGNITMSIDIIANTIQGGTN